MRQTGIALVAGILFGAGLGLSGMMDPARVRGFLDVFGAWDPTLAFVMGGALAVMAIAWAIQRRTARPAFADSFKLPATSRIDARLISGSVLFGVGWGIAGLCPGPAIASLATQSSSVALFIIAMVVGMGAFHLADRISMKL